jgi:hypothetical protein
MLNQIKRCATCAKHTPHTPTGDCTWCAIAYARQVEAAIEAVDLANSAAIAEAARNLPGDRYALRVLVNQARTAYIDLCVKDVIADFGEEGAPLTVPLGLTHHTHFYTERTQHHGQTSTTRPTPRR